VDSQNRCSLAGLARTLSIEAEFRQHPAGSIKEAVERIFQLTGIRRSERRVEVFLKRSGFKFRKAGSIPAKANLAEQEEFLKKT
jgi:transposase